MAKYSRLETAIIPAYAAIQARRAGDMQGYESNLKRMTDAMDTMTKMAQLKQQIDMMPYEIEMKQALGEQYRGTAQQALATAESKRAETARQADIDRALQEYAKRSKMPFDPRIAKEVKDSLSTIQLEQEVNTDTALGLAGLRGQQEASELEYKTALDKTKLALGEPRQTVAGDMATSRGKELYGVEKALGEKESAVGQGMYDIEKGRQAKPFVQAQITDLLQTGGLSGEKPINIADKARDNINAVERQETNIYNALTRLDALYKSEESDIYQQLSLIMPSAMVGAPNVAGKDKEVQYNTLRKYYTDQLPSVKQEKQYWKDLEKQAFRDMGIDIPEPAKTLPANPMHVSAERWDSMSEDNKKGFRSYRGGILIDTPKGTMPVNEYEKRKSQEPTGTNTQQSKLTTKTEQPQKTGNTITEKKASSLEEWKKRRDKQQ